MTRPPVKLYRHPLSGHCHRVELALSLLGLPVETIDVDLAKREQKTRAFLELNPFGQVPVIDDGGTVVHDSNAILVYLARRYDRDDRWLPRDPVGEAAVQVWFSAAAGPLAFGPASSRVANLFGRSKDKAEAISLGHGLLAVMEQVLTRRDHLAAPTPTFADVALYSYVAVAPEGDVDLAPYARVRTWLARIEALPGFVPMRRSPVGLAK